jgi:deoxyadenosine/deoxycytidine kinase
LKGPSGPGKPLWHTGWPSNTMPVWFSRWTRTIRSWTNFQRDLFSSVVISDYLFHRDRIFAGLNLEGHELHLYEQLFNLIKIKIPKPDLVIFLQAETPILHGRVEKRGRRFEQNMEYQYLEDVNRAFNNFFFYYAETPLLVINTNEIDLAGEKYNFKELINKINNHRIGREYYNPLGS